MTRRAHNPSDKQRHQVEGYAGIGLPHHMISKLVGIDTKTLLKHYAHELDLGKAKATAQVAKTLYDRAINGKELAAAIFWLKCQAQWSERHVIEVAEEKPKTLAIE